MGTWKGIVEGVSTFSFLAALSLCTLVLLHFLWSERHVITQRMSLTDSLESQNLPTIIGRLSITSKNAKEKDANDEGSGSLGRASWSLGKSKSDPHEEKTNEICEILIQLAKR